MTDAGTYTRYPALITLPALVRKQRRLESKIAPIAPLIDDEKAVRKDIDALLVKAGIAKGDKVTCHGYDVAHVERVGTSRLNQDALIVHLEKAGLRREWIDARLAECTETGEPSMWATVKPSKGSKVRT